MFNFNKVMSIFIINERIGKIFVSVFFNFFINKLVNIKIVKNFVVIVLLSFNFLKIV